jgi:putative DNA primase/helicase
MNNYSSVMDQLRSYGLIVDHLEVDGRVHRCRTEDDREKRGWYLLHTWRTSSGDELIVGSFGRWSGQDNNSKKIELDRQEFSAEEKAAFKARLVEDRKRAQAQRDAESAKAAMRASSVWSKALAVPPDDYATEYLSKKSVSAHGVRWTPSGAMVVPMMDTKSCIHGLQFIFPSTHERRKKLGRDKEYWPTGLSKVGHYFMIGSPSASSTLLVAEGYATAATLHEATGLAVAVAFDAGNLQSVAKAIKKAYRGLNRIIICADDDYVQKCKACGEKTTVETETCIACGAAHGKENSGVRYAAAAALAVGAAWIKPIFPEDRQLQKITDFNDLALFPGGGLHEVRSQVEAAIKAAGFDGHSGVAAAFGALGGGEGSEMPALMSIDDAVERFCGTFGFGGKVLFDTADRRLVAKEDVMNLLPGRSWDLLKSHRRWRIYKDTEIGFDPTESDPDVKCNLFVGWPTTPKKGDCSNLLELLEYLCSKDPNAAEVYQWVLKWFAYPLQHRGAKMQSAVIFHGPQGTGKSMFVEAIVQIYGPYGRVLGQEALEDKFNADWAEKKLFIVGDEVLARQDMYHIKNRLKGFITGDTIRVNPKNMAAHTEKNQMNIAFLSNERMPLVLENDDRRHCVIWTPQKLPEGFYQLVSEEIKNGGIAALHQHLLDLDLGDSKAWTKPPMTDAKRDLINLGISSEDRFISEWKSWEIENKDGQLIPFCPCLGSSLYRLYESWCEKNGERKRKAQDFIGYIKKLDGWVAGESVATYQNLHDKTFKKRKMIIPSALDLKASPPADLAGKDNLFLEHFHQSKAAWLTHCFFEFENAIGLPP